MSSTSRTALGNRPSPSAAEGTPAGSWRGMAAAAAAVVAVSLAGLVGLGLAVVVVSTLDPGGGLTVGGSLGLAGRLWLLANGGELRVDSGPLRLAPLLLTAAISWGLSRAGRFAVHVAGATAARTATLTAAALVAAHTLLTV